jgi:CubicO group peptidase (beta-lactamase class C family)
MKFRLFCLVIAVATLLAPGRGGSAQEQFPFQIFDRYLEPLIQQIGMPGLSAVILQNGQVAWEKYYGFADVENQVRTSANTLYPVGGVTQAVTGVLVGVCADRYFFPVDQDIRAFAPAFPVEQTSIRQVLAHATGGRFRYDATLFSALTPVVEGCTGQAFRQAMATEVLNRLALRNSVPGLDLNRADGGAARALFPPDEVDRYQRLLANVAVPYRIDAKARSFRSEYSSFGLDAANGLVTTAADLAKFEGELDKRNGVPLSFSTLDKMWSNQSFRVNNQDIVMPTGLGWFVTMESGQRLVWSFGHLPNAASALIVKMPSAPGSTRPNLTLILLANSGGLAQGYDLENANVTSSPFVKIFLRLFI